MTYDTKYAYNIKYDIKYHISYSSSCNIANNIKHFLVNIITLVLICLLKDYLQVENYIYENLLILPIQVYHEPS